MAKIIPAILAENYEEMREQIANFLDLTKIVQIDICDGKFVNNITWPMNPRDQSNVNLILSEEEGMPYWEKMEFEFDLMVANASEKFEFFSRLGARRMVFHLEAEYDKEKFKEFLEGLDMYTRENTEIGLALNTTTDIKELDKFISLVDFVQVMGIEHIGQQGEKFDIRCIDQIKGLKEKYPELVISVDGSVNEETAELLIHAGAKRLVVGSALIHSFDPSETMHILKNIK